MMEFVDSHVHLADPAFDADRDSIVERARQTGALALVCIGESLDAARRARALAEAHPGFCFHTAGVHPHDAADFDAARALAGIREEIELGAAKTLTDARRGADRAMVFDEQKRAVALGFHFRHVAFFTPNRSQLLKLPG